MYTDSKTATSVLTADNFQSGDSGVYQCIAVDRNSTTKGDSTELRGKGKILSNC